MTLGPDFIDLSDDAGNLRPEVARVIAAAPDRPVAPVPEPAAPPPAFQAPPAAPFADGPWRAAAAPLADRVPPPLAGARVLFPQRPVRQLTVTLPDFAATRISFMSMLVITALAAAAAGFLGTSLGLKRVGQDGVASSIVAGTPTTTVATAPGTPSATQAIVSGVNVIMRTGPGLGFPVASRLMLGERLNVGEERDGWCSVTTATGASGWVYAGLIRGRVGSGSMPALVRQVFVSDNAGMRVVLKAGQKVLRLIEPDGSSMALLPDGTRVPVPAEVLVDAN